MTGKRTTTGASGQHVEPIMVQHNLQLEDGEKNKEPNGESGNVGGKKRSGQAIEPTVFPSNSKRGRGAFAAKKDPNAENGLTEHRGDKQRSTRVTSRIIKPTVVQSKPKLGPMEKSQDPNGKARLPDNLGGKKIKKSSEQSMALVVVPTKLNSEGGAPGENNVHNGKSGSAKNSSGETSSTAIVPSTALVVVPQKLNQGFVPIREDTALNVKPAGSKDNLDRAKQESPASVVFVCPRLRCGRVFNYICPFMRHIEEEQLFHPDDPVAGTKIAFAAQTTRGELAKMVNHVARIEEESDDELGMIFRDV